MENIADINSCVAAHAAQAAVNVSTYHKILEQISALEGMHPIAKKEVETTHAQIINDLANVSNGLLFYIMETSDVKDVRQYTAIAQAYCPMKPAANPARTLKIVCSICKGTKFDVVHDTTHICCGCGNQKDIFNISPSHKDSSRMNTALRYTYKRRIHFKDCINQYQGKQNVCISDAVIASLYACIHMHGINNGSDYSAVNKEQLMMFLKESGHSKHYEDINLIYKLITGKSVDDITYLEDALIQDFNMLTDLYDKKFKHTNRISRKSFINTQYVLFQLLRRHKHPCKQEDFNILKTIDRKLLHEDIISELFNDLGWNFTSLF